jgi:hypothetical protein
MSNKLEIAKEEWLRAKAAYEAAIQIFEISTMLINHQKMILDEKFSILMREQTKNIDPKKRLTIVKGK